jgi:hypothetical protein
MKMKQTVLTISLAIILASPVIAGDNKATVRPTTSETRTHYQYRFDPDPKKSGWKKETDRLYHYEITDDKGRKSTARPTTSETRSHYQYHFDPDSKKSGWRLEHDRVYNYEIKGGDHKGSWKEKSRGKSK